MAHAGRSRRRRRAGNSQGAVEQARSPDARRADGHRAHARRKPRRRHQLQPRVYPAHRPAAFGARRLVGALRKPGARGRGGESRGGRAARDALQGAGARVRGRGVGGAGRDGASHCRGRGRRRAARGPEGRSGHARDAHAHEHAQGHADRRDGRAVDRRAVLGGRAGLCIGHVSPKPTRADDRVCADGDIVSIVWANAHSTVACSERTVGTPAWLHVTAPRYNRGWLARYAKLVTNASRERCSHADVRADHVRGAHPRRCARDVRHSRWRDHAVLQCALRLSRPAASRPLPTRQGAGHAARLCARSGRVGVCIATSGPGATNS